MAHGARGSIFPILRNVWHNWRRVRLIVVRGESDGEATSRSNLELIAHAAWLRATCPDSRAECLLELHPGYNPPRNGVVQWALPLRLAHQVCLSSCFTARTMFVSQGHMSTGVDTVRTSIVGVTYHVHDRGRMSRCLTGTVRLAGHV